MSSASSTIVTPPTPSLSLSNACTNSPSHLLSFLAPVVVVSEQHQPTGGYPVTVQHHNASMAQQGMQGGAYPMPAAHTQMPMPPPNYGQYGGNAAPYPTNAPYPMGMPQPAVMPMPPNPNQNPPSYNEVVGNEAYQKQAPFNPNFSS